MVEFVDRRGKGKQPQPRKPNVGIRDVQVTCRHCGHEFAVQAAAADTETTCPECAKPTGIPAAETKAPVPPETPTATLKKPRSQIAKPTPLKKPAGDPTDPEETKPATVGTSEKDKATTPAKKPASSGNAAAKPGLSTKPKCPECGTSMEKGAVICLHCGHDTREEVQVTKPTMVNGPQKRSYLVPVAVGLILVSGAAYYLLAMNKTAPPPAPEPPSSEPPAPPAPVADSETPSDPEPQPEPGPAETPEPPAGDTGTAPDLRQQIIDRLNARQPVYTTGDTALLTARDGKTYRGKIIEINETAVRLYYRGSEGEVPIRALSPQSRSQVDPPYREQMIDSLVERSTQRSAE